MSAVDLVKWLVDLLHFIFIYRRGVVTCQHSRLSSITMLYKTPLSGNILTFGTFWPSFRHFPSPKYIVCWAETSKNLFLHIWYNILCKKTHPTIEFGFRYPSVGDSAGPFWHLSQVCRTHILWDMTFFVETNFLNIHFFGIFDNS